MKDTWSCLPFIGHVMPMRGYHLPMSRAMNSIVVNDATYYRSRTPYAPAFYSLSIRTQAFTYIKMYKSCIHSSLSI
ncbi:Pregnancy zone [Gossypium arboreum]|uniref:Pregnancy zone n=1 Tax=Gossypium arboreum TaxID=29729 RepID=A0A0B0PN88_GOSAR|nr:Pregnancy zone [Gossypium arboreum]